MKPCSCPTCGHSTTLYALRDAKPQKPSEARMKRIRNLAVQFKLEGYDTRERDTDVACAVAQMMAVGGEEPHLQRILDTHMERLVAAQYTEEA